MDFTDLFKQSLYLCRFSPNAKYLAAASKCYLFIREATSLQIVLKITWSDIIQNVIWSPDSELILVASYKTGKVTIYHVTDKKWCADIEEGTSGLTNVKWSSDGRTLLCFSDFQLRITIWSLITQEVCYIQYPKYYDKGHDFRKDGRYFVLAERRDGKDYLGVYDCDNSFKMVKHFQVDTFDLENLTWSPDGRFIAVWDNCIQYKVLIYTPDGRCQQSYSAYDNGLGVKFVTWAPSSQFLAIGSYDQKIRFLNHYTWTPIIEFTHAVQLNNRELTIWKEELDSPKESGRTITHYVILEQPLQELHSIRPDPEKPNPKIGVGICKFNSTGRLMASRNDNMPNCLWIWDISLMRPIVLFLQRSPIRHFYWNPMNIEQLVMCCGNEKIYFWSGQKSGAEIIEVPTANFKVNNIKWNPNGKSLILMDKELFTIAFIINKNIS
ncbi:WD40-repeat-containing domain protein [Glomus cerebriforme]|uniref:WD40-repeat-containing domain protein n=1 Tax=Glomus cerebriforme TaxID=658196 RepID=A0A397SF80_9GLOM|nr:WD40-repeat-containing domain protein [Glomus cerebriforme]